MQSGIQQNTDQNNKHILVCLDTTKHILKGIVFCGLSFLRILQFGVVFFDLGCKGKHHKEEQHRGNQCHCLNRQADMLADEHRPDNTCQHGKYAGKNALILEDGISFFHIIGQ